MENFRVGTLERFGLDYATLSTAHPGLILCSISAYGQSGSRAARPGYDAMIQASGGLMSVTGEPDEAGGGPLKVGVAIADIMAGMYATTAILAALVSRRETGLGQAIDVPLYDSQVAWLANQNMNYLVGGECPGRLGSGHPNLVPYQSFATRDGHLMLAVGNDRQFARLTDSLGLSDVASDARFCTNAARVANRGALIALLADAFRGRTTGEWLDELGRAGVPAGPINSIADVFSEDYAAERGLVQSLPHATAGHVPSVANPVRFSGTPVTYRQAPPMLGEHTRAVLRHDLGMSDESIDELVVQGVIQGHG
jgi:formyl-CoA transferase